MKLFEDRPGYDPIIDNKLVDHYLPLLSGPAWNLLSFMAMDAKDYHAGAFEKWYTLRELQQAGGFGSPDKRSTNSVISGMRHLLAHQLAEKKHTFVSGGVRYTFEQREIRGGRKAPIGVSFKQQEIMYRLTTPPEFENLFRPNGTGFYTPFPRLMVEQIRPVVSDLTWKIISVFTRHIWGFDRGKGVFPISYSKLRKKTGIKDNETISKALDEIAFFMGRGLFHIDLKGYNARIIKVCANLDFCWPNIAREKSEIYPQAREKSEMVAREKSEIYPQAREKSEMVAREKSEIPPDSARKIGDSDRVAREKSPHVNTDSFLNTEGVLNKESNSSNSGGDELKTIKQVNFSQDLQAKRNALITLGITNDYGKKLDNLTNNETVTLDMIQTALNHQTETEGKYGAAMYVKYLQGEANLWIPSVKEDTSQKLPIVSNEAQPDNDNTPPWEEYPAKDPIWEEAKEILAGKWTKATMMLLHGAVGEWTAEGEYTIYSPNYQNVDVLKNHKGGRAVMEAIQRATGQPTRVKFEVRK